MPPHRKKSSKLFEYQGIPISGDPPTPPASREPGESNQSSSQKPGRIIYKAHPSILAYPRALFLSAIILIIGLVLSHYRDIYWVAAAIASAIVLLFVLVERSFRHYLVSEKRIELIWGIKPGLRGLLGVGTVEFATAGSEQIEVAFKDVGRADKVKRIVRSLQDHQS